jgi:hypothetical protein
MRTAPVALAFLGDPQGLTEAAAAVSALTHFDEEAGEACVLWCHAIRHAVLTGDLDARAGLGRLPEPGRDKWAQRLTDAEHRRPQDFSRNGWVVEALQAAWCAIATTLVPATTVPATCAWRWKTRCAAAGTPTRSPPSRAACSVRATAHPPCPRPGSRCCTAGPA